MNKYCIQILCFLMLLIISCNEKKLTEVVEVPLPSVSEKRNIGSPDDIVADEGSFILQKLPYKYDALAPNIDALTMELHYSKHYLSYTNALNRVIVGTKFEKLTIEEILKDLDPADLTLRNNAGGFYNHSLYFENITSEGGLPKDTLEGAIRRDFGNFSTFKKQFTEEANKQFGSAWTWLIIDKTGKLIITSTANQDNTLMSFALIKGTPLLALDLWEHAYYLNYQQNRKNYVDAFFKVINWEKVQERYENSITP